MGLELTTDRYPPITSQTRYPLRHAVSFMNILSTINASISSTHVLVNMHLWHYVELEDLECYCLNLKHLNLYTRSYPLHYFPILILEEEPVFPFSMLSAKQANYWYHFWYEAVLDWGLNPGPPALDASTLPLGYRGGSQNKQRPSWWKLLIYRSWLWL